MRKLISIAISAALIAAPAGAAELGQPTDVRPGAFVGVKFQMSLAENKGPAPRAALAIAPTQSQVSANGMVRTRIGEGIALDFAPNAKPTLTLAGVRADTALGLQRNGTVNAEQRLGISTGGWVAVGVGVVAVGALAAFVLASECRRKIVFVDRDACSE